MWLTGCDLGELRALCSAASASSAPSVGSRATSSTGEQDVGAVRRSGRLRLSANEGLELGRVRAALREVVAECAELRLGQKQGGAETERHPGPTVTQVYIAQQRVAWAKHTHWIGMSTMLNSTKPFCSDTGQCS